MKKNLFSFLIAVCLAISYASAGDFVLADFDGGAHPMVLSKYDPDGMIWQNSAVVSDYDIVANPQTGGYNPSPFCMRVGQPYNNSNGTWWGNNAGIEMSCASRADYPPTCGDTIEITSDTRYLKLFVYRTHNVTDFSVWITTLEEGDAGNTSGVNDALSYRGYRGKNTNTTGWYDLVIDLNSVSYGWNGSTFAGTKSLIGKHLRTVVICNSHHDTQYTTPATTFYYDNFVLSDDPTPRMPVSQSVSINPTNTADYGNHVYQTIEGFGASDAWAGNYVGEHWTNGRVKAAKYLFDASINNDGSVNGIGLSMWRFNLGAGSLRQGTNGTSSGITFLSRRADSFIVSHSSSNPSGRVTDFSTNRHTGQQWFLNQAWDYGCRNFVAFAVSPPVQYTANGRAYLFNGAAHSANLNWNAWGGNGQAYAWSAEYWVNCLEYFQQQLGIPFRYLSPLNEPEWDWQSKEVSTNTYSQEGCPYTNNEAMEMCRYVDQKLWVPNTPHPRVPTKILYGETGRWDYAYAQGNDFGRHIPNSWYLPSPPNNNPLYIGGLWTLEKAFTGHSYHSTENVSGINSYRTGSNGLRENAYYYKVKLHQTEWSMLEAFPKDAPFSNGHWANGGTDVALYMARTIHADLALANVSSWSFWTAMDPDPWGYYEGRFYLLGLDPSPTITRTPWDTSIENAELFNMNWPETDVTPAKTLWALGNYSLFVRPGYQRCALTGADNLTGLMGTAYIAPEKTKVVAVYVNLNESAVNLTTTLTAPAGFQYKTVEMYQTDQTKNLERVYSAAYVSGTPLSIARRSVTTVVYTLEQDDVTSNDIVLAHFDGSATDPMEFAKYADGNTTLQQGAMITQYDVVSNPKTDGINPTPYCMAVGQAKTAWWWPNISGIALPTACGEGGAGIEITNTNRYLKFSILRNHNVTGFSVYLSPASGYNPANSGTDIRILNEYKVPWEDLGKWKEIVIDLGATPDGNKNLIGTVIRAVAIVNSSNWTESDLIPTPANTIYYDNFSLSPNPTPRATIPPITPVPVSTPSTWTPQAASTDWNDPANWTPTGVPDASAKVIIPKSDSYPELSAPTPVEEIHFEPGAQIGGQSYLTGKAFVQYDLSVADRWWMLSIPLGQVYPADFAFGGYPVTYMQTFASEGEGSAITKGQWIDLYENNHSAFTPGDGFVLWLDTDGGNSCKGLKRLDGIRELPFFQHHDGSGSSSDAFYSNVNQSHEYDGSNSTFYNFELISGEYERKTADSYTVGRTSAAYQLAGATVNKSLNFGDGNFALVGNPFMATLDFDAFYAENATEIKPYFYIWTGKGYEIGGACEDDCITLDSQIAPLQGFLVEKPETPGSGLLTFTEAMTTVDPSATLRSSEGNKNKLDIVASNPVKAVRTIIAKREGGKTEFGDWDARKIIHGISEVPEIYSLKPYRGRSIAAAINLINNDDDVLIPLGLATSYAGNITLSFSGMNAYDANISLIDAVENRETDLTGLAVFDYVVNYTPKTVNGVTATCDDRFFIRIAKSTTGPTGSIADQVNVFVSNNLVRIVSGTANPIKEVMVYDLQGMLVHKATFAGTVSHAVNLWPGTYIVKVISEKNSDNVQFIIR